MKTELVLLALTIIVLLVILFKTHHARYSEERFFGAPNNQLLNNKVNCGGVSYAQKRQLIPRSVADKFKIYETEFAFLHIEVGFEWMRNDIEQLIKNVVLSVNPRFNFADSLRRSKFTFYHCSWNLMNEIVPNDVPAAGFYYPQTNNIWCTNESQTCSLLGYLYHEMSHMIHFMNWDRINPVIENTFKEHKSIVLGYGTTNHVEFFAESTPPIFFQSDLSSRENIKFYLPQFESYFAFLQDLFSNKYPSLENVCNSERFKNCTSFCNPERISGVFSNPEPPKVD